MSAHIPLERLAAAFLAGLLHLAHTSPQPVPFRRAAQGLLGSTIDGQGVSVQTARRRKAQWSQCGLAAQRVSAWMSQARVGSRA